MQALQWPAYFFYYSTVKLPRSTNGGGENSPLLSGEDDYYEMFMAEI